MKQIRFPDLLPITARVKDITDALAKHQVVIVAGATGSGKTTQLPKIALAMGRAKIGVTQPRRIAATSVAARVAQELEVPLGAEVGYQIRFEDKTSRTTAVKFMTDGILLAEIQGDRLLRKYDTLIIDEAHERSLTIDFLLGWLKRILPERPDLKVVVSSATIETERFSQFFANAPVVQVEGRTFPVDVLYQPANEDDDMAIAVANAVTDVIQMDPHGDVLVFLPGEREIKEAENVLRGRALPRTQILPLYARLSSADQSKVFSTISERRVVLATNVAETSLTIPGIVYVVDTGVARLSRYEPRSGTTRLQIEAISQASADQRKGRCGRVREGICIRLYDEQSFAARPGFTDPEIKRTGLAGVILRMKSLGLGDVEDFPFLDPPHGRAIAEGYRVLEELGAIDENKALTRLGSQLARFPVDPRISRMILAASEYNCLREILIITAALNSQDPRERPRELQQKADDLHRRFRDEGSDFVALLKMWDAIQQAQPLRKFCRENFMSFMRVREWREVHRQLEDVVRDLRLGTPNSKPARGDQIHKALLTGLLSKIGAWSPEKRNYMGAKQTRFLLHPSSALAKKPPQWVMAFELVETSQLFARMAAKIEPDWILEVAPELLKRSHSEAHWSERAARAQVRESSTLFGLLVAKDRVVDYSLIDPAGARRMFIEHALVRGEFKTRGTFHAHNRALFDEVARLRDKARKSDMMADDSALFAFFDARVPADIVNGKTFEEWLDRSKPDLRLSIEQLLVGDGDLRPEDYPDTLSLYGTKVPVSYKFDPSADDDGVTLTIPLVLLPQLERGALDWIVPGWHKEKIDALVGTLTKATRKELAPVDASQLVPFSGPLLPQLSKLTGVPAEAFRPDTLVHYLRINVRVVDANGKIVEESRDVDALLERHGARARTVLKSTSTEWEKTGITRWDFEKLPEFVVRRVSGIDVRSYPALVDRTTSVDLTLKDSVAEAEEATRLGVRRLFMLHAKQTVSTIQKSLPRAFSPPSGNHLVRADNERFWGLLMGRIVDEAFASSPRDRLTFERALEAGAPRLNATTQKILNVISPVTAELDRTLDALDAAKRHPSGKAAIDDIYAQLQHLFPNDLVAWIPLEQLAHYPRYLKAAQARLTRAVNDPRKDAEKNAPLAPLWKKFLDKKQPAGELRWAFEELRVAIFAPELKTAIPVSLQKVSAALA